MKPICKTTWKHENGAYTVEFTAEKFGVQYIKTYRTRRGAKAAETRFHKSMSMRNTEE